MAPAPRSRVAATRRASVPGRVSVSSQDHVYFLRRAEAEIELAQHAEHPKAVAAHYYLAQPYLKLAYGDGSEGGADRQPN